MFLLSTRTSLNKVPESQLRAKHLLKDAGTSVFAEFYEHTRPVRTISVQNISRFFQQLLLNLGWKSGSGGSRLVFNGIFDRVEKSRMFPFRSTCFPSARKMATFPLSSFRSGQLRRFHRWRAAPAPFLCARVFNFDNLGARATVGLPHLTR